MRYAGESVTILTTIKIDGILDDPATVKISITKDTPSGTAVVPATDMTNTAVGSWEYDWDSTGQNPGVYYAKVHGTDDAPGNWEFIQIVLA